MYKRSKAINEAVVIGRTFRRLFDEKTNTWKKICFWEPNRRPFTMAAPINTNINTNTTQKEK